MSAIEGISRSASVVLLAIMPPYVKFSNCEEELYYYYTNFSSYTAIYTFLLLFSC